MDRSLETQWELFIFSWGYWVFPHIRRFLISPLIISFQWSMQLGNRFLDGSFKYRETYVTYVTLPHFRSISLKIPISTRRNDEVCNLHTILQSQSYKPPLSLHCISANSLGSIKIEIFPSSSHCALMQGQALMHVFSTATNIDQRKTNAISQLREKLSPVREGRLGNNRLLLQLAISERPLVEIRHATPWYTSRVQITSAFISFEMSSHLWEGFPGHSRNLIVNDQRYRELSWISPLHNLMTSRPSNPWLAEFKGVGDSRSTILDQHHKQDYQQYHQ